ncbi:5684_t:CDS:2 [Entrophospora sp. SA101]|nr:5684_t:CDS:2 [Entrophospora sp. SA101]
MQSFAQLVLVLTRIKHLRTKKNTPKKGGGGVETSKNDGEGKERGEEEEDDDNATNNFPNTPLSSSFKKLSFSSKILFHDTWTPEDYDRRGDQSTCNQLTPILAQQIKDELNEFKMGEMQVHEDTDISDLNSDPLLRFQHRNFLYFALGMGFLLPTLGGFYFAAVLRLVVVHHATFCVNSLAHFLGDAPFDDRRTPRDHFLTAIFTLGEGYHNFHHEFPMDYRNAIKFYQYDPTKWLIRFLSYFKLTHHLKKFPDNEIKKGILLMKQKKLDDAKKLLYWGVPLNQLPVYTFDECK